MHGRSTLRVFGYIRRGGKVSSAEAVEILPDATERVRAILCYRAEIERAAPTN